MIPGLDKENSSPVPGEDFGYFSTPEEADTAGRIALGKLATTETTPDWSSHFDDWDDDPVPLPTAEFPVSVSEPEDALVDVPPMEKPGKFKEQAPRFSDQVDDATRTNPITYVSGVREGLSAKTENTGYKETTLTEHETLVGLREFLHEVAEVEQGTFLGRQAEMMPSDLTFIGGREYAKAAEGMAIDWRERLSNDPQLQLCVVTGKIMPNEIKSDAYLLDTILKSFTDDDIDRFKDRLVFDIEDITVPPEHTAVIVLDDWVISGGHMSGVADRIRREHSEYLPTMEVQLVAASRQLIDKGLLVGYSSYNGRKVRQDYIPVNAFYQAHTAKNENGVRITGATCAVDYGFNDVISEMSEAIGRDMPPGTNIVRPYRSGNVQLAQLQRFVLARAEAESAS